MLVIPLTTVVEEEANSQTHICNNLNKLYSLVGHIKKQHRFAGGGGGNNVSSGIMISIVLVPANMH